MIIRLLGTGAADGIPGFYSDSRVSRYARQHGGKDIRSRSAALLDRHVKIDLPPDTLMQMQRDRLDARDWSCIMFTHSHADHFSPDELQYCLYPFNDMEHMGFAIYGNRKICTRIREMYPDWPIELTETQIFRCFRHGDYQITPVLANHMDDEQAQNLVFTRGEQSMLYATDTGVWPDVTWEYLQGAGLDALIIECTEGIYGTDYEGHLDVEACIAVVERLRKQGSIKEEATVVTTHHSHNGGATHAELEEYLKPHGIHVGFDGLEVEF
jgi:phosphoribosyl 1,2-cyclic phosphate phosphodiesterase